MSDLKEETNVENNDEIVEVNEEVSEKVAKPIDPSLEGIQLFYEKNKKMVTYVGGGLALLIALFVYYKFMYLPEKEKEAANEAFWAQAFFERDSFNLSLKGGPMVMAAEGQKQMMGFEQIADEYSMTKVGNLSNYYAGVCLLRTGKYEQAIERFNQFSANDALLAPIALGATGDAYMQLNNAEQAVKYYLKAADKSNNSFTTPLYLKKAGFAYELKANYAEALGIYERIKREYGKSAEGKEIERDIAKVKTLGNL
ncbi:MAG: tetratricopeptide repeat protein [Sphingobacteriaceae bacterium]|nr:tetratricopeptide repeat protein [Sphingobacteriaceae bacterium]